MSDLEKHEFSDGNIEFAYADEYQVFFDYADDALIISRDDVIAMAKHFEITADELKG